MFPREKFLKSKHYNNHSTTYKNMLHQNNKFHQKSFLYPKNQASKKFKKDYDKDKENANNNIYYTSNKKYYCKHFRYHKKFVKTKFDCDYDYFYKNDENFEINTFDEGEDCVKRSKDEKYNSLEYATTNATSAYSNSSSAHEEINNNNNYEISYDKKNSIEDINKQIDTYNNISMNMNNVDKNLGNMFYVNIMKLNMNLVKLNSNNDLTSNLPQKEIKKIKYKLKNSDSSSNSLEPYNKYNEINKDLDKTPINPMVENTEILNISVKISQNKTIVFKLRRFDDLFMTVKLFCEINQIEERFIKPIIIKTLCGLNSLYQIFNCDLDSNNIQRLMRINQYINKTFI